MTVTDKVFHFDTLKNKEFISPENVSDIIIAEKSLFGRYRFRNQMTGKTGSDLDSVIRAQKRYLIIDDISGTRDSVTGIYMAYNKNFESLLVVLTELKNTTHGYEWKIINKAFIDKESDCFVGDFFHYEFDVDICGQAVVDKKSPQFKLGPWFSYDIHNNKPDGSKEAYIQYTGSAGYVPLRYPYCWKETYGFATHRSYRELSFICGSENFFGIYNYNLKGEDNKKLPIKNEGMEIMLKLAKITKEFLLDYRKLVCSTEEDIPLVYLQRIGNEFMLRYFMQVYDNPAICNSDGIGLIEYKRIMLNESIAAVFMEAFAVHTNPFTSSNDIKHGSFALKDNNKRYQSFISVAGRGIICYVDGDMKGTNIEFLSSYIDKAVDAAKVFIENPSMWDKVESPMYNLKEIIAESCDIAIRSSVIHIIFAFLTYPLIWQMYDACDVKGKSAKKFREWLLEKTDGLVLKSIDMDFQLNDKQLIKAAEKFFEYFKFSDKKFETFKNIVEKGKDKSSKIDARIGVAEITF